MTAYTTRTTDLGKVTFTAPAARDDYAGYVWLETDDGERRQICHGGDFRGSTVTAYPTTLKATAQAWMRQRRGWMRKEGF